jgi:hypothetical protein
MAASVSRGMNQASLVASVEAPARPHRVHDCEPIGLRRIVIRRPREVQRGQVVADDGPVEAHARDRQTDHGKAPAEKRELPGGAGLGVETHGRCREVRAVDEQEHEPQELSVGRLELWKEIEDGKYRECDRAADQPVVNQWVEVAAADQAPHSPERIGRCRHRHRCDMHDDWLRRPNLLLFGPLAEADVLPQPDKSLRNGSASWGDPVDPVEIDGLRAFARQEPRPHGQGGLFRIIVRRLSSRAWPRGR